MPFYDYRCSQGHVTEQFRFIADRDQQRGCPDCGALEERLVAAPQVMGDIPEHFNPSIAGGTLVKGRQHLRELQEKHGLMDYDPKDPLAQPSTSWKG